MDLLVAKKMSANTARSFIFSRELLNAVRKQQKMKERDTEFMRHLALLERLTLYGNYELFVINTANTGMISMNALPLAFKYAGKDSGADDASFGRFCLDSKRSRGNCGKGNP